MRIAKSEIDAHIAGVRESRLEAALSCSGIQHALSGSRAGTDTFDKLSDGCLERIKAIEQRHRDESLDGRNKFGIKQAPRLVGRDCKGYPVRPARARHRESASRF